MVISGRSELDDLSDRKSAADKAVYIRRRVWKFVSSLNFWPCHFRYPVGRMWVDPNPYEGLSTAKSITVIFGGKREWPTLVSVQFCRQLLLWWRHRFCQLIAGKSRVPMASSESVMWGCTDTVLLRPSCTGLYDRTELTATVDRHSPFAHHYLDD
jgi:hypothetical protein